MANFRVERPDLFPAGTVVKAYDATAFQAGESSAVLAEATASATAVVLAGLQVGRRYVASGAGSTITLTPGPEDPGANRLGEGDSLAIYTPDPGAQLLDIRAGSAATPDSTYAPLVHVSRTLSVPESAFSGDGSPGLSAVYGAARVPVSSEGQGIAVMGSAVTDGTHTGSHGSADGVGGYFVGEATESATRAGIGAFVAGRRASATGETTGIEIVSFNGSSTEGTFNSSGASNTKGIWLHATGSKPSGVGLQIGRTVTAFVVGIGFNVGAISSSSIYDESQSLRSIRIAGEHSKAAISIKAKAGDLVLNAEEASGGGKGIFFVGNAETAPAGTPTAGGVLYATAGALFWKGSSGTVTELGKA